MITRLGYAVRKTLWYWLIVGEWSDPRTHYRKHRALTAWLRAQERA